ncbi:uncharacterized protein LOC119661634 isoform X2 [Hermetia illucens]|uniref:uncharacterized protein LOC119661634 isoform X2 n=1 Tax=Hermetia illucens TaxID=343691 RepID=UPI0018CC7B65|nr:uncharacterized protein LOC119661634 isoform X2 [Hermetia illucens]
MFLFQNGRAVWESEEVHCKSFPDGLSFTLVNESAVTPGYAHVGSLSVVLQILTAYYGEFFFLIAVAVAIFIYGSISSISSCFEANWRCLKVSLTILTFATGIYLGVAVAISYFVSLKIIVVSTAAVCLLTFSAYFFYQCQNIIYRSYNEITSNEYIFATTILYADLMAFTFLFMNVLSLAKIPRPPGHNSIAGYWI